MSSNEIIDACKLVQTQKNGKEKWFLSISTAEAVANSNKWELQRSVTGNSVYQLGNYFQIWQGKYWELYRKK